MGISTREFNRLVKRSMKSKGKKRHFRTKSEILKTEGLSKFAKVVPIFDNEQDQIDLYAELRISDLKKGIGSVERFEMLASSVAELYLLSKHDPNIENKQEIFFECRSAMKQIDYACLHWEKTGEVLIGNLEQAFSIVYTMMDLKRNYSRDACLKLCEYIIENYTKTILEIADCDLKSSLATKYK